jgi:hypothetical protein
MTQKGGNSTEALLAFATNYWEKRIQSLNICSIPRL